MKAIIPVAGFGTRMLPLTKTLPKCMIPIGNKPTIHYIIDSYNLNEIEQFVIITGRGQGMIQDYFMPHAGLETALQNKQKNDLLEVVRGLSQMGQMTFVPQHHARGLGHAIHCAAPAITEADEFVLIGLGDMIFDPQMIAGMINLHRETGDSVVAVTPVDPSMLDKYGVVGVASDNHKTQILTTAVEKPGADECARRGLDASSALGIVGCYILHRDIFDILAQTPPNTHAGNEIQLTDAIETLLSTHTVRPYQTTAHCRDIGRPSSRRETNTAFHSIDYDIRRLAELQTP